MNLNRYLLLLCAVLLCLLVSFTAHSKQRVVTYSWAKSMQTDARGTYPVELLKLALAKSNTAMLAKPSEFAMSQHRTMKQLELDRGIDVVWTMTNAEREKHLRPIRIPIDRGLIGWRLLAIRKQDAQLFQQLPDEAALRTLLTVQGTDWPDFAILHNNGFRVVPSNYFAGMYQMLQLGRVRFFARSITEIWLELQNQSTQADSFQVAPRWVLHYPAALYFFVRNEDAELAQAIETGLEAAIQDGSMKQLFLQHFQDSLTQAALQHRQVVSLQNPELPPHTPVERLELWFNPERGY